MAAVVAVTALTACVVFCAVPTAWRGRVSGISTVVIGALSIWLGFATLSSGFAAVRVGWLMPLTGATFSGDATSALFTVVTGAVATAAGIFSVGYTRATRSPSALLVFMPVFVAAMALVPFAGSVSTFLLLWELMALASLMLVLVEYHESSVRDAGVIYAVMTQLGFVAILLGLAIAASFSPGETFAAIGAAHLSNPVRGVVFVLTFVGFGSKAGLVPLHIWLPHAHPAAPSPASALMSAAMVNLGIYGLVRFDVQLLGDGQAWWGLLLVVGGGLTAVYSVLQASVASDLKRLLAYSTSENMGLVLLAIGAAMLLATTGNRALAVVAMTAALLHVVNHAAFKTLGFLAAGSVFAATGERDLDLLGGLARPMPVTTTMFGIAALGATGLPLGAGFVSEWLLLQSLIHTLPSSSTLLALVMPLAVGVVAMTAGLGVAAMVKAFGIGFLARPRSDRAAGAAENPIGMLASMALPAAACGVLAVAPAAVLPVLRGPVRTFAGTDAIPSLGTSLRLPGVAGTIAPGILAGCVLAVFAVFMAVVVTKTTGRRAARRAPLWACGGTPLTPRMQYTATSFAEPLQRVFDDILRPDIDIDVTHLAESRYLTEKVSYRARIGDAVESRVYVPVVRAVTAWGHVVRRMHMGSVHAYLAFGAAGLLVALVVAR